MHYVVYGRETNLVAAALIRGLRAMDHKVTVQRAELFRPNEAIRAPDRVVVSGLRGKYTEVKEHYRAQGIPIIVREAPHFRDTDRVSSGDGTAPRHQRLSLDQHAWIPPFNCPHDRFESLCLEVVAKAPKGRTLLVCGQTERDTQHGLTGQQLASHLADAILVVRQATGLEPVWRPHPLAPDAPKPFSGLAAPESTLAEALADAGAVLTYNSTVGLTATRMGIPVYCCGPATYRAAAHVVEAGRIRPRELSGVRAVTSLLARVAYTQWTMEELESGAWVSTIERSLTDDVSHDTPEPVEPAKPAEPHESQLQVEQAPALALGLDQAVATVVQKAISPFSLRETLLELEGIGVQAKRPAVRSELDQLVEGGALEVTDPGGRGRPRKWEKAAAL